MKKMKTLWAPACLSLALSMGFTSLSAHAEPMQEIKQPYQKLTLNANLMLADGKSFGDEMVLLTHGTLTHKNRSTYTQLQKNLAAQGISSLAINLSLGLSDRQGEYDCAVPHTHKHTDALKEIDFWVNWLKQQGAQKITLVGHSRGGNQTAWYANEQKHTLINAQVLIAPATGEQQSASEYQEKYGKPLETVLNKALKLVSQGKGDSLMADTDFIYCKKAQVAPAAFVDYYQAKPQFDTPTLLKSATIPTLVIMGGADTLVPDLPARLADFENSSTIKTQTLDDADHFFLDFANEDAATAIVEFMQGL